VDTAEDLSIRFHAVPDDAAIAMRTNRRQRVDRALKTVEDVSFSPHDYFERFVVIVPADFACRHTTIRSREKRSAAVFICLWRLDSVEEWTQNCTQQI
jgi:hypothetical protein